MAELRSRPNLDQLRRQARDLLRGAEAGDQAAAAALELAGARPTLTGAQHAVARQYGFESWPKLKAAVEGRLARPPTFVIRHVASPAELRALWAAMWRILGRADPPDVPHWRVFERFDEQRSRMLVVEHEGQIVGGTIGMRLIALEPWARGIGLGRRLLQTVEGETAAAGLGLTTHADERVKGFYFKVGYTDGGKSRLHMSKGVPLSPTLVELRTRRWRDRVGDLGRGVVVTPDPATGTIPPLPW